MRVVQLESFLDGTEVIVEGRGGRQRGGVLGDAYKINNPRLKISRGLLIC